MSVEVIVRVDGTCVNKDCSGGGSGGGNLSTTTVSIPDNANTAAQITAISGHGIYLVLVKSTNADGASATFTISKGNTLASGNVNRTSNSAAGTDERVDISWPAGSSPLLYHSTLRTGGTGVLVPYTVGYMGLS